MNLDKNSFIKGVEVGQQIKGWAREPFNSTPLEYPFWPKIIDGTIEGAIDSKCLISKIEAFTFYECEKLSIVSFPECLEIGKEAFGNCIELNSIYFPKCKSISYAAFYNCIISNATFPECTYVGEKAFLYSAFVPSYHGHMTSIYLPKCEFIDNQAFDNRYMDAIWYDVYLLGSSVCDTNNGLGSYSYWMGYKNVFVPSSLYLSYILLYASLLPS